MRDDDKVLDFNFWPSFSDVMLVVVFILVLVLFFFSFEAARAGSRKDYEIAELRMELDSLKGVKEKELWSLREIRNRQTIVAHEIQRAYEGELLEKPVLNSQWDKHYALMKGDHEDMNIYLIKNLQQISFSDKILFEPNQYELTHTGRETLLKVGRAMKDQLSRISRIQIEGHTDSRPTVLYKGGNIELGAMRAISVYKFFEENPAISIDPKHYEMSANSFGEHKPIDTSNNQEGMAHNRRIELLLFYGE